MNSTSRHCSIIDERREELGITDNKTRSGTCATSTTNSRQIITKQEVFERDSLGWSCRYCNTIPLMFRAPGSFSKETPNNVLVEQHLHVCRGTSFYQPDVVPISIEMPKIGDGNVTTALPHKTHYTIGGAEANAPSYCPRAVNHQFGQEPSGDALSQLNQAAATFHRRDSGFQYLNNNSYQQPLGQPNNLYQLNDMNKFAGISNMSFGSNENIAPYQSFQNQPFPAHASGSNEVNGHPHPYFQNKSTNSQQPFQKYSQGGDLLSHIDPSGLPDLDIDPAPTSIVLSYDRLLLTDYFYFLMQQLETCHFRENDRKSRGNKRDNIPIGYAGVMCKHCSTTSRCRKFFWSNVDRLANSFSEIPVHIKKCKHCPNEVKDHLDAFKSMHPAQMSELPRGSQKVFFRRLWRRLHGANDDEPGNKPSMDATDGRKQILLLTPEDKDWLSDLDCFVRSNLELFIADEQDAEHFKYDPKMVVANGNVGIRCKHCAHLNHTERLPFACFFPSSISSIFDLTREFQKKHLFDCPNLPEPATNKIKNNETSSTCTNVSKRFYVLAAKTLGLFNDQRGVRAEEDSELFRAFLPNKTQSSSEIRKIEERSEDVAQLDNEKQSSETVSALNTKSKRSALDHQQELPSKKKSVIEL